MPKGNSSRKAPLAVRLEAATDTRLSECAKRTKLNKHQLMIAAIEAAIEAIEAHDGYIVMPIEFAVKKTPIANRLSDGESHEELPLAAEDSLPYGKKRA